jgi:hypothetical protein
MKDFYGGVVGLDQRAGYEVSGVAHHIGTRARVAVYDDLAAAPYVEDIGPAPAREFIQELAQRVYGLAAERGGSIPYTVVREVSENLIHSGFAEPVVSILDSGTTIRFSDQGPGIIDKQRALLPGYSTATSEMKQVIRGVGSGLPLVRDYLALRGGSLTVEDNLRCGSVITISCAPSTERPAETGLVEAPASRQVLPPVVVGVPAVALFDEVSSEPATKLTTRQKHVLALVLESGSAGPSIVSRELGVGLSTAYRDLASLEDLGLIVAESGKRTLTEKGIAYLGEASQRTY